MKYMEKVKGYLCECQLQFAEFCCELNTAHIWQQQRLYWSQTYHHQLVNISKRTDGKVHGAVSIRKTVLPGMAIPMLKIRRPNGRLIFNMEITIRR